MKPYLQSAIKFVPKNCRTYVTHILEDVARQLDESSAEELNAWIRTSNYRKMFHPPNSEISSASSKEDLAGAILVFLAASVLPDPPPGFAWTFPFPWDINVKLNSRPDISEILGHKGPWIDSFPLTYTIEGTTFTGDFSSEFIAGLVLASHHNPGVTFFLYDIQLDAKVIKSDHRVFGYLKRSTGNYYVAHFRDIPSDRLDGMDFSFTDLSFLHGVKTAVLWSGEELDDVLVSVEQIKGRSKIPLNWK